MVKSYPVSLLSNIILGNISMAWYKTVITPLPTHRGYHSLALIHPYSYRWSALPCHTKAIERWLSKLLSYYLRLIYFDKGPFFPRIQSSRSSIGLNDVLAPNRRQTIIWINGGLIFLTHKCINWHRWVKAEVSGKRNQPSTIHTITQPTYLMEPKNIFVYD